MNSHRALSDALGLLGDILADRGLAYQVVIVGGSALLLTNETSRPTRDVDVIAVATGNEGLNVAWNLPAELEEAVREVADLRGVPDDWLNAGAVGVLDETHLPADYEQRLHHRVYGNLVVSVMARMDLLRLKMMAAADEGPGSRHVIDITEMHPSTDELADALAWARSKRHAATFEFDDIEQALGMRNMS